MDFLLLFVPLCFLSSFLLLIFSRKRNILFCSSIGLVASSTGIFGFFGAFQNYGAAWGGGQRVNPAEYGFVGFFLSLFFTLVVLFLKRGYLQGKRAQQGGEVNR